MSNTNTLLVGLDDFKNKVDLHTDCDIDRLTPHIKEAQDIHISNKIGWELLIAILENPTDARFTELLCGSVFEYCGKTYKHYGLKCVLVYYSYGIYKYLNNYVDQSYGTVYKQVADSVPVDNDILTKIRNQNFNLANEYWENVKLYLCANKEDFTEFDTCNCHEAPIERGQSRLRKAKTFKKYGNDNNYY